MSTEQVVEILRGVLKCQRGPLGHIVIYGWQEEVIRAALAAHEAEKASRCTSCDGTGEGVDAAGEWRGYCVCEAGRASAAPAAPAVAALAHAVDALEEIALAGMSGSGQESEEGLRDWHARRAFQFIGIAARAREKVREITSPANTGPAT